MSFANTLDHHTASTLGTCRGSGLADAPLGRTPNRRKCPHCTREVKVTAAGKMARHKSWSSAPDAHVAGRVVE